jgi:hypothetical protein
LEQKLSNDIVVLWTDPKRAVLIAHSLKARDQLAGVIDVGSKGEDDCSEGAWLSTIGLIGWVEEVIELRMRTE